MKQNIFDYISNKKDRSFVDVDFHDFVEMNSDGLSDEEISKELGIPRSYVNKLQDDLKKDY